MDTFHNTLFDWPHQAPSAALHCLADADFVRSLELGPAAWWQAWQKGRLSALLQWTGHGSFDELPVQRREDYQAQFTSTPRIPPDHGSLEQHQTSGSSGVPVAFWRSELAMRTTLAHYWADHQRQGRNLHAVLATITGTPGPHEGNHRDIPGDPWMHPGRQLARNAPQFTMEEHARWICEHAPTYLATTPATLSSVLSIIEMQHWPAPRIAQVMTSSHAVEPELRERARRILGASIRDRYSCEEIGPIAFQCPESDDHYHVAVGNALVEVVDESGRPAEEGASGRVLVTGLHQWASPALRYDLGDIATLHTHCPACGATVPALSHLLGRKFFLLHSTDGGLRHVRILAEHWLACAPVREHRVVQTDNLHFRAEVVLEHPLTPEQRARLLGMLRKALGPEFAVDLVQLNAIAWPASGKRQEFVGLAP